MKPRSRTLALLVLLAATLPLAAGVTGCTGGGAPETGASDSAQLWYCPMHPTQTSHHPGDCPICQMRLVLLEKRPVQPALQKNASASGATPATGATSSESGTALSYRRDGGGTRYRSTMLPGEVSDHPGKDSMGMEMVPMEGFPPSGSASPAGWSEIQVPAERLQRSGVTFGRVVTRPMARAVRTVGRVALDETRIHHIHTKFNGWIEEIAADYVGKVVRQGDLLCTIYSPELVATQEEYLQALRAEQKLTERSSDPELTRGARDLVEAARRRFELWDIGETEIREIELSGRARRTLPVYSPITGIVTEKLAQHGMYVTPEQEEFTIADLSNLWVLADVYESELSQVREGQKADLALTYSPGRIYHGRIAYISPTLEPGTRTVKVRIEVPNHDLGLKPDMIAEVTLFMDAGLRTVLPRSAVLLTGETAIAFIDLGGGRLQPREISLGLRFDDDFEVLSGLAPGDRVVTSATFLIDSESRLRSALAGASPSAPAGQAGAGSPSPAPGGGSTPRSAPTGGSVPGPPRRWAGDRGELRP